MTTGVHDIRADQDTFTYGAPRLFEGSVVFVDVRRSSEIVSHVEKSFGLECAAEFFMRYLAGCMTAITSVTPAHCQPSGDAVLAVIEGPDRVRRAVDAASAAIRFVSDKFERENRNLLSSGPDPGRWRHHKLRFEVGAGIADGIITESILSTGQGESPELVGSCVSLAAKLSGWAQPPNSVAITYDAFRDSKLGDTPIYRWTHRVMKLGGRHRHIVVTRPPRL